MKGDVVIDEIFRQFDAHGQALYIGEPVSVSEHMLQTAHEAEKDGASPTLVAAALLHDFGHLTVDMPEDSAEHGIDTHHEEAAAAYLSEYFVPEVVEPVRLHVAAKRYLCATDPSYLRDLSPASQLSLQLQGGPFSNEEIEAFEALPHSTDAVRLRRYDDIAKVPGAWTPDLEHYRTCLRAGLR
jgi:gamma-butyrobetaine dioxygenase